MGHAEDSIRAFLAIELGRDVRASLAALIEGLKESSPRVSWVNSQNLHLTLRFLGEIRHTSLDNLVQELAGPLHEVDSFKVCVQGIGAFPNTRKPSVIWAGVSSPPEALYDAQAITESAARSIGLEPDERRFSPHITLGRIRNHRRPAKIFDGKEYDAEFHAGEFTVQAVSLFSSELTPNGAIHRKLKEFRLKWTST